MIRATVDFAGLFGPGHVFSPVVPALKRRWLPPDPITVSQLSGGMLSVVGDMPVLVEAGACSGQSMAFLRESGLNISRELISVADHNAYLKALVVQQERGRRVVTQHRHPDGEIGRRFSWIDPELLSRLNNKANLARFVAAAATPLRAVVAVEAIPTLGRRFGLPVVIKAVTGESSGSGADVHICRNADDLTGASKKFSSCERVVVERFYWFRDNFCLNFFVKRGGSVFFLGGAEQITSRTGGYRGGWVGQGVSVPDNLVDICEQVMRRAGSAGYWGLAGVDAGMTDNNRIYVYDLNFRANASVTSCLLYSSASRVLGRKLFRNIGLRYQGPFGEMLKQLARLRDRHDFLPLNLFDPAGSRFSDVFPRVAGLVACNSKEQAGVIIERMVRAGFLP